MISGEMEVTVAGCGTLILKAGDRHSMPAEKIHSARVVGSAPVVYLISEKNFEETVEK